MRYIMNNVKLETGYEVIKTGLEKIPERTVTNTGLYNLLIENGSIKAVHPAQSPIDAQDHCRIYDAKGLLMVPAYTEKHCHIDKTYYGEPWRAVTAERNIINIVESESELYPTFETSICQRAKRLIDTFISHGSTTIRTHVDIAKGTKLNHLEEVLKAFYSYGNHIDWEIVAFPQHGLLRTDSKQALSDALSNGATHLGGLDPYIIDENREKSLYEIFDLAVKHNVDIDYHLHEGGAIGLDSFKAMIKLIEQCKWQNRVAISHALFLSDLEGDEKEEVAHLLANNGVSLISQVPVRGECPDFPYFDQFGVQTALGIDCINDSWWPYGTGSVLEKLNVFGQIHAIRKEKELSQALKYISGYTTPLNAAGEMVWPKAGDKANLLLIDASCTAEVVGRRRPNHCVIHNGNILCGSIE